MKVQGLLDNTTQQMRKGILELCILSIISDEGEAYPTDIIKRLEKSELMVVEGTMYPLLARLKSAGLLDYTWRESASGQKAVKSCADHRLLSKPAPGRKNAQVALQKSCRARPCN